MQREQIGEQNHSVSCFVLLGKAARKELVHVMQALNSYIRVMRDDPELRGPQYEKILERMSDLIGGLQPYENVDFKVETKKMGKNVGDQQMMDF